MTLNEQAAEAMGWEAMPNPFYGDVLSYYCNGRPVELAEGRGCALVSEWHPDTDYNHAHLLVQRAKEQRKMHRLVALLDVVEEDYRDDVAVNTLLATPEQITRAAVEVLT